jgi:hypothetical protein
MEMRIEIRQDKVMIDGYVNAVARDSRPIHDSNGEKFIEQIMPGAFTRALERAKASNRAIDLLLDHEEDKKLGDTNSNLKLIEDNIGLRAICEITDPETMQKAREGKLRGWSFGFMNARAQEEDAANGMKRRYVEDMDLKEVSLIDDRKTPCYAGTSVNTRADDTTETVETRSLEIKEATITDNSDADLRTAAEKLQQYRARIEKLSKMED